MFVNDTPISFEFEGAEFVLSDFRLQILSKPYPIHYHSKNSYEIHYIKSGVGSLVIDDKIYSLSPNSLFITGPYINHGQLPNPEDPLEKYSIYFNITPFAPQKLVSFFLDKTFWIGLDEHNVLDSFEKIKVEFTNKILGYENNVISLLKILIISIIRNYEKDLPSNIKSKSNNDIIFEIERSFLYEFQTLTLDKLANRLFMGKRQLERTLMKYYKKNFQTLKTEARMSYAANELKHSKTSISDIANNIGYSSVEHFSVAFKKFYHLTPLKYRKKMDRE